MQEIGKSLPPRRPRFRIVLDPLPLDWQVAANKADHLDVKAWAIEVLNREAAALLGGTGGAA